MPTHKRADSAAAPKEINFSPAKPTVKRANTLERLRPRAWTKGATVAAPAPLSSPDQTEEIEISVPCHFLDNDDGNDQSNLSTGTFHGLTVPRPRKAMFKFPLKKGPAMRPPLSTRDSMESRASSETVVSSAESSEATCASPNPEPFSPSGPPSRPSLASLFGGSLGPIEDPDDEEHWEKKSVKYHAQLQWHRDYEKEHRAFVDCKLRSGYDIDFVHFQYMTDEQKAKLNGGPWIWDGVEHINGHKEGKWVVKNPKEWAKHVKKLKAAEEKANKL